MYYNVRSMFNNYPSCLQPNDIGLNNRTTATKLPAWEEDFNNSKHLYIPPSIQIVRIYNYNMGNRSPTNRSIVVNPDNNVSFINISMCKTSHVFTGSILGLLKLRTLDMSHGSMVRLTPQFVDIPNLQNFNISHNKVETASLEIICTGSPNLIDFDVSYNRLRTIAPSTFSNNPNIAHIKLGGNALLEVELELGNLTRLESLSLNSNSLTRLANTFVTELEHLSRRTNFTLDIRNNSFVCSCDSVEFVRWIQTTNVDVVSKDKLSCTLKNRVVRLIHVSLTELEDDCRRFLNLYSLTFATFLKQPCRSSCDICYSQHQVPRVWRGTETRSTIQTSGGVCECLLTGAAHLTGVWGELDVCLQMQC